MSPPPCLRHFDAELLFNANSYVNYHSRKTCVVFMGPSLTIVCQWGNFGALLCPRGTTYTPLRGMFSHSLIASSNGVIHMFLRNSRSELRLVKVGRNVKSMGFFGRFFAPCTIIVRPIAYKRYSTPFLNRPHDLTPHSWVCDKRAGGVANRSFVQKKKNNNKYAR